MSQVKQKSTGGWLKKGALMAGVSALVGAASGFVAKTLYGKRTETKEVPISWDNLNDDLLFKAIGQKWQSYAGGADLSTKEGWLQMSTNLKNLGNTTQAENAMKDLFDVQAMSQKGYSFTGFLQKENLAEYIPRQDATESIRSLVAEKASEAFEAKWGFAVDSDFSKYSIEIAKLNNPSKTEEMLNDRFVVESWTNNCTISDSRLDNLINTMYPNNTYDLSSMTSQEKSSIVIDYLSQEHHSGWAKNGVEDGLIQNMTIEDVTRFAYNAKESGTNAGWEIGQYYRYQQLTTTRDNVVVDMRDVYTSFSDNTAITNANMNLAGDRQDILQEAIEEKFNLTGEVDLRTPSADFLNQVDPSSKEDLVNNLVNSGAYIRDCKMPLDEVTDIATRTGVRDIVEGWISNGDTTAVEQTVGTLGDTQITGISGLGSLVTFGIMFGIYKHKQHQIKKMCDANPAAAEQYNEYLAKQQEERAAEKAAKKAKKHGKIETVEDDFVTEDTDELALGKK